MSAKKNKRISKKALPKTGQLAAVNEFVLRNAFENSDVGMVLISENGKFLKVNKAFCRMLGSSRSELLSRSFREITHPDDLSGNNDFIKNALRGKQDRYQTEKRYIHKNGSIVWGRVHSTLVKDKGAARFFFTQIEDITEKKKISDQLRESEDLLQLFIEHSPAALAMFDMDMKYIQVSRRWLSDFKIENIPVIGRSHYDVLPDSIDRKDIHQRCLKGAVEKREEDSFLREDGSTYWLKWEIRPWRKLTGEIGGLIIFTEAITDRKEAELKFRNLVERSPVGVYIVQNDKYVYANPAFSAITGYSQEEIVNRLSVFDIVLPQYGDMVREKRKTLLSEKGKNIHYEVQGRRKDGSLGWVEVFGSVTLYNGAPAMIGTFIDISERKKNAENIINEKNLSDTLINELPGIFYLADRSDFSIIRWNKNIETVSGYSAAEIRKMKTLDFVEPAQHQYALARRDTALKIGKADGELTLVTKDKKRIEYFVRAMPIEFNGRACMLGIGFDITEQKNIEEALIRTNEDIRELNAHLQIVREEERTRIAREIHDELGQQLTGLKIHLDLFTKKVKGGDTAIQEDVKGMNALIDGTVGAVKRIISDLRPGILDDLGLIAAMEWQAREFEKRTGIRCDLVCTPGEIAVPKVVATTVFRIYQESLTNVMRYASASCVESRLEISAGEIKLTVKDDGKGFEMDQIADKKTMGLLGMQERAYAFGGKLRIESKAGKGTMISVSLPLTEQQEKITS